MPDVEPVTKAVFDRKTDIIVPKIEGSREKKQLVRDVGRATQTLARRRVRSLARARARVCVRGARCRSLCVSCLPVRPMAGRHFVFGDQINVGIGSAQELIGSLDATCRVAARAQHAELAVFRICALGEKSRDAASSLGGDFARSSDSSGADAPPSEPDAMSSR